MPFGLCKIAFEKKGKKQYNKKKACGILLRKSSGSRTLFILTKQREKQRKRIQSACVCQALHFMLKEDAAKPMEEEAEKYKKSLERRRTRYKITEEAARPDGPVLIRIIKQCSQSPAGSCLD